MFSLQEVTSNYPFKHFPILQTPTDKTEKNQNMEKLQFHLIVTLNRKHQLINMNEQTKKKEGK